MNKHEKVYDIDALERGRTTVLANITAMETALEAERAKLSLYDREIAVAEATLRAHGIFRCQQTGKHDWQVLKQFDNGSWKQRRCRDCGTEERLGYDC